MKCRRVRALSARTEFVPSYGMITFDPDSKRANARFPLVPEDHIAILVKYGWVADDTEGYSPQLDHDGDGEPGGSISGGDGEDMTELRKQYRDVLGKNPFPGWDAGELKRRMAEHEAASDAPPAS